MLRETGTITNPSTLVRDLDPLIERVVLRCRETDPDKRPASALQVAAALPGGNPPAAALAARETPSPEMVAAAGGNRRHEATARSGTSDINHRWNDRLSVHCGGLQAKL